MPRLATPAHRVIEVQAIDLSLPFKELPASTALHFTTALNSSIMGKGSCGGDTSTIKSVSECNGANIHAKDLPTLIVFDLDDCLWTPEMHDLSGMPSISVEGPLDPNNPCTSPLGTVGMKVPSGGRGGWGGCNNEGEEIVELYVGARLVLRELLLNPKYQHVKIAVASTSLVPSYSRACIAGLEIIEGTTMKDVISYAQIGRSGQLSSRKTSHFKLIHEQSKLPYSEQLFFDDCNWCDHVGDLSKTFGVVGVRTPNGLRMEEFYRGLELFRDEKRRRNGED